MYSDNGLNNWLQKFQSKYSLLLDKDKNSTRTLEEAVLFLKEVVSYVEKQQDCVKSRIEFKYNCVNPEKRDKKHDIAINYSKFYRTIGTELSLKIIEYIQELQKDINIRRKREEERRKREEERRKREDKNLSQVTDELIKLVSVSTRESKKRYVTCWNIKTRIDY